MADLNPLLQCLHSNGGPAVHSSRMCSLPPIIFIIVTGQGWLKRPQRGLDPVSTSSFVLEGTQCLFLVYLVAEIGPSEINCKRRKDRTKKPHVQQEGCPVHSRDLYSLEP